jgi:hypothetical protein
MLATEHVPVFVDIYNDLRFHSHPASHDLPIFYAQVAPVIFAIVVNFPPVRVRFEGRGPLRGISAVGYVMLFRLPAAGKETLRKSKCNFFCVQKFFL